jgi:hypothetical protein
MAFSGLMIFLLGLYTFFIPERSGYLAIAGGPGEENFHVPRIPSEKSAVLPNPHSSTIKSLAKGE